MNKRMVMAKLGVSLGTKLDVRLGGVLLKIKNYESHDVPVNGKN